MSSDTSRSEEPSARTFANEDHLPRVPLPSLEESCDRFLAWCAPLLSADELASTERAVRSSLETNSPARKLQAALEEYDRSDGVHSWLDTFWPDRYLGRRDRIAVNANFFFLFNGGEQGQAERAAGLIAGAVDYKLLLDAERIPPVLQKGRALSMEQNKFLFSATRIPGSVQDTARVPYTDGWPGPSQERHIVVFFHGHLFRMEVIGPDGRAFTPADLARGLRAVMVAGATPAAPGTSVGHLTTKARAEWASSRQALLDCHPGNAAMLDTIETGLFCICLEDLVPKDAHEACDHLLAGDSANRWFDKAISMVIFGDGTAGLNGEHCKLDGTTVVSFMDTVLTESSDDHARRSEARSQGLPPFGAIEFVLDAGLLSDVRAAAASFAEYTADTVTWVLSFEDFGAEQIKQMHLSPDAFVQMAYQVAHQRARGLVGATYESIATRQFQHGRTEAMRVVTPEVIQLVAAMDDPRADDATRRAAFRAAADKHGRRARECTAGQAPEQHLWELELLAQRSGAALGVTEPLALYETPGWLTMRADYLSTSSVPSVNVQYWGFGSTSSRCIGVGYALLPDRFRLYLSTSRAMRDQMVAFADELRSVVRELRDLLSTEPQNG
ncbi:MAG: choline/carnitine O-acyltransferase [Actinomycetota bacterium]|nr:choline/carnitine O-acyltransferase [Actinomycetota bacterium]